MTFARFTALHLGAAALAALLALQAVWHAWLLAAPSSRFWPTLVLAIVPLLPGLWICQTNMRRGVLVGGIVGLFYFCHGVSSIYSDPPARVLAALEIALTLLVIGTSGWDARHYRRKR